MPLITERVELARAGQNPAVLCKMPSGWAVLGDEQGLPGYCLLLADPVVPSLNDLDTAARARFLADMALIGDAILEVTGAYRVNYEILGNSEPELHVHIFARYESEPAEQRRQPVWMCKRVSIPISGSLHGNLKKRLTESIVRRLAAGNIASAE